MVRRKKNPGTVKARTSSFISERKKKANHERPFDGHALRVDREEKALRSSVVRDGCRVRRVAMVVCIELTAGRNVAEGLDRIRGLLFWCHSLSPLGL